MLKASTISIDQIKTLLMNNNLGILLVENDGPSIVSTLLDAVNNNFAARIGITSAENDITVHIIPVNYCHDIEDWLTEERSASVYILFKRWTAAGLNKHHSKSPFGCKAFQEYLKKIEYVQSDYVIVLVPNDPDLDDVTN